MDDTALPTWAVYQPRSAQQKHLLRSCISPVRSIIRDQSESMSGAAVSTRAVYQPRPANQKHIRRRCISPARYITCDQRTESLSGAAVYQQQSAQQTPLRHRSADICNMASTSVCQQWATEPKARLDHIAASIITVRYINRDQQGVCQQLLASRSCKTNKITSGHDTLCSLALYLGQGKAWPNRINTSTEVVQVPRLALLFCFQKKSGISTAISKAYISSWPPAKQ